MYRGESAVRSNGPYGARGGQCVARTPAHEAPGLTRPDPGVAASRAQMQQTSRPFLASVATMRSWVVFLLVACSSSASAPTRTSPAQPAAQRDARAIDTTPPPTTAPAEQPTRKAIEPLPTACAPKEKLFRCHALALAAHLGIDRPAEPAAARALYADACSKGYAPSCNNLAVLATMHSELATGLDTASLWATACKKLDLAACDNARRVQQHRELAVKLTLGDTLSPELKAAACRIGDVFQCDDAASRQKLGALLAEECRGGQREQCFDAANSTQDSAAALELMTLACKQRDGRACHALAKRKLADGAQPAAVTAYWKTACSDDNFNIGPDAIAARNQACDAWSSAVKSPRDLLAIAKLTQPRCENDDQGACTTTTRVLDRAGASARAFALVKRMCQGTSDDSAACLDLADQIGRAHV